MLLSRFAVVVLVLFMVSCSSTTRDYKGVYEASEKITELDVPPELDKPVTAKDSNLNELGQSVKSISIYEQTLKDKPDSKFEPQYKGMKFKRDGSLYWLEVKAPADEVWDDLRAYFTKLGFDIEVDNTALGYMQTGWLENRVDIPGNWLSNFFNFLYSADIMDRYRIRLEWDQDEQISRVFIIHQGLREMVEGEKNDSEVIQTKWVVRPSDPELEVEMLMRFMAYRGLSEKLAETQVNAVKGEERTKLVEQGDATQLLINDAFQRSWRHMSIAIDRLGYLVEDQNRSAGVFYVQLPETFEIKHEGVFSGIFTSGTAKPEKDKYLIILEDKGAQTVVTVKTNGEQAKDFAKVSRKILKDIKDNIL